MTLSGPKKEPLNFLSAHPGQVPGTPAEMPVCPLHGRVDFGVFIDPSEEFCMPPVFGFGEDRASSSPLSPRSEHFEFTRVDVVSIAIGWAGRGIRLRRRVCLSPASVWNRYQGAATATAGCRQRGLLHHLRRGVSHERLSRHRKRYLRHAFLIEAPSCSRHDLERDVFLASRHRRR